MFEKKNLIISIVMLICALALGGCSSKSDNSNNGSSAASKLGGSLKVAYPAQPTSLDPHLTTANATRDPARHIFETLVTLNSKFEVTPMLAESYEVSKDRKKVTFVLRKGIKFHNGKEMKAEDVIASMTKWQEGAVAKANLGNSKWEAEDEYTVILHVETPSIVLLPVLAEVGQFAAIMPKEVIESADTGGITEYIGTGPFKFVEWKQNQYVHLKKFDDYQASSQPADGLAGKKEALVDDIYFHFVTDNSTRVAGMISGEYDLSVMMPWDAAPQFKNVSSLETIQAPLGIHTLIFNKQNGFLKNVKARQAVNLAIDKKEVLTAAVTDGYFRLDPGYMLKEQGLWYTDTGKEIYEAKDTEKAKQLLKEAGYNGEELRILTSRDYSQHYNSAVAVQQQLQKIGMNVKLDVVDWSTLLDRRNKPDQWEMFFTSWPVSATPLQYPFLDSRAKFAGWTNNPEIDKLLNQIKAQSSQDKAKETFNELQRVIWEDMPVVNIGAYDSISVKANKVKGYQEFLGPVLWNTTAKE